MYINILKIVNCKVKKYIKNPIKTDKTCMQLCFKNIQIYLIFLLISLKKLMGNYGNQGWVLYLYCWSIVELYRFTIIYAMTYAVQQGWCIFLQAKSQKQVCIWALLSVFFFLYFLWVFGWVKLKIFSLLFYNINTFKTIIA